jgi:hypothetical protein
MIGEPLGYIVHWYDCYTQDNREKSIYFKPENKYLARQQAYGLSRAGQSVKIFCLTKLMHEIILRDVT